MSSNDQSSPIASMSLESMSITDHQTAKLKELFPEVFTEGSKIDFDKLKRTLGETVDAGKERFGMNWAGKADCFKTIQQPSVATLVPAREESVDFDTTENVFIEGDNLEVLKLLQKSYLGKIKMIYIDPPYNTGNDFIYPDNYSENLDTYLEYTGQIDGEGRKFSTNVDTDGRFHSKWMNMMYPRLFLAKNLLRDDGVIFISIDEKELNNLQFICHELFGEQNVEKMIWNKEAEGASGTLKQTLRFRVVHETILVCYKSKDTQRFARVSEPLIGRENELQTANLAVNEDSSRVGHSNWMELISPTGKKWFKHWKFDNEEIKSLISEDLIYWGRDGNNQPRLIIPTDHRRKVYAQSIINKGGTTRGRKDFEEIMEVDVFSYPKPTSLISYLMQISVSQEIILDFFAGSATTAHSVLNLNKEDGGNRKYICVQLPEPTDEQSEAFKAGYKTISEISKERIRRATAKVKAEVGHNKLDLGFRVFKLQQSNFKVWDSTLTHDPQAIQLALDSHIEHINPDSSQEDILFELLLKAGFQLTTPIEKLTLEDKTVFCIADNALIICLEKELTLDVMKAIAEREPARVIVLDEGFQNNDQLKTNAALTMKAKGVLDFRTV